MKREMVDDTFVNDSRRDWRMQGTRDSHAGGCSHDSTLYIKVIAMCAIDAVHSSAPLTWTRCSIRLATNSFSSSSPSAFSAVTVFDNILSRPGASAAALEGCSKILVLQPGHRFHPRFTAVVLTLSVKRAGWQALSVRVRQQQRASTNRQSATRVQTVWRRQCMDHVPMTLRTVIDLTNSH